MATGKLGLSFNFPGQHSSKYYFPIKYTYKKTVANLT